MPRSTANSILDIVEANDRAELYEARWNDQTASRIVPKLIALLESADRDVLLRALSAFVTIASRASTAARKILPHLRSDDPRIAQNAIWALARVSLDNPELAIDPLISVADVPGLRKPAMQALVGFGAAARRAAPLFAGAFADPSADVRCLALRGLAEVKAAPNIVAPILAQAAVDKSRRVREYAAKKFPTFPTGTVR
jgi:hypothetical protein